MEKQEILSAIQKLVADILEQKGLDVVTLDASTELLGGELGIDSLDLATLVRELEETTGRDPFSEGFIEFRTAGELADLYVR
ncbi:MAG: acyl carrier protein [Myxococcales bacterium]|jgi:acyl carrier protein|nr:acyl carrier protein [Myxococcales bacterium]